MLAYEAHRRECRMALPAEALDDPTAAPLRALRRLRRALVPDRRARRRRARRPVASAEPGRASSSRPGRSGRAAWTGSASPVKGRIAADEQVAAGRAVARLTDLGWGSGCARCSPRARRRPGRRRAAGRLRRRARRAGAGSSGRSPSSPCRRRRRPAARRSRGCAPGQLGRLPLARPARAAPTTGPRGEPGGNSAFRLAGVWDAFAPSAQQLRTLAGLDGPVLLVDDLVDSRWTLTVAGRALRRAGAPGVLPFALAVTA